MMNYQPTLGYIAFYNGSKIELYDTSLVKAKDRAVALLHAPKSKQHMVSVYLAEKDGVAV